jgi:hypothetical protein
VLDKRTEICIPIEGLTNLVNGKDERGSGCGLLKVSLNRKEVRSLSTDLCSFKIRSLKYEISGKQITGNIYFCTKT